MFYAVACEAHWFANSGLVLLKELTVLVVDGGLKTTTIVS